MSSINRNNIIDTLQKILSVSPHKIFVVTIFTDVSGHEDWLDHSLVQEPQFGYKGWVILLVVDKAFLIFWKVPENGVLLFIHVIKSSGLEPFARVFIHVIEVDLEVVFEDLPGRESSTVEMERWYVDSAVKSMFSFWINFVVLFALLDWGYIVVGHFEVVYFVVTLVVSSLLFDHWLICYSISKL